MTKTSYILIDYENVQSKDQDFDLIPISEWHVKVFMGPKDSTTTALLDAGKRLGPNFEIVSLLKSGSNALDFLITYHLGRLQDEGSAFYIISKDGDFDPLLEQLRRQKIVVFRFPSILLIPAFASHAFKSPKLVRPRKPGNAMLSLDDLVYRSITDLKGLGDKLPATLKSLHNRIKTHLNTDAQTAVKVAQELQKRGIAVANVEGEISYQFEKILFPAKAA